MQKINMNGKEFRLPDIGFKEVLALENSGINLLESKEKPLNMLVGVLSLAIGDFEQAALEVENFVASGGDLKDVLSPISKAIEDSSFFQSLAKNANKGKEADN